MCRDEKKSNGTEWPGERRSAVEMRGARGVAADWYRFDMTRFAVRRKGDEMPRKRITRKGVDWRRGGYDWLGSA